KTWGAGRYCSGTEFADAVDRVRPVAERFRRDAGCPASVHGMASLAASCEVFRARGLELVVMETGMGGRFDLVQGLRKRLTVITDLGLDHTRALGETLEEIAWHKAGIMEPRVPCVAVQGPGWPVLEKEARALGTPLHPVRPEALVRALGPPERGGRSVTLVLPFLGEVDLVLPGPAAFQVRNAAVAAAALDRLAAAGLPLEAGHLAAGFREARYPGRYEEVQASPRVILDGAHNPQKAAALLETFRADAGRGLRVLVAGLSGAREGGPLLAGFRDLADLLVATRVELYGKATAPAGAVAAAARAVGLRTLTEPEPERALDRALAAAGPEGTVLVTGSLYLVGRLRDRWYPWPRVLLEGTSWPSLTPGGGSATVTPA
ncbi:MAG: hypothetical protein FJ098_15135, partial [Deltaproteobacteria bacterium]|nr:hypothetical protein [Deltaproteobacteria bacterium]